jgi:hypothetical protein
MVSSDRKPTMHFTHESCMFTNPAECIVELLDQSLTSHSSWQKTHFHVGIRHTAKQKNKTDKKVLAT